jgi:hypothetical protein
MIEMDTRTNDELLTSMLQKLHDSVDVLAAIGAACRLLCDQLGGVEDDVIELMRRANDGGLS